MDEMSRLLVDEMSCKDQGGIFCLGENSFLECQNRSVESRFAA